MQGILFYWKLLSSKELKIENETGIKISGVTMNEWSFASLSTAKVISGQEAPGEMR